MHTRVHTHTEGMGVEGEVKGRGGGGTREGKEVCHRRAGVRTGCAEEDHKSGVGVGMATEGVNKNKVRPCT